MITLRDDQTDAVRRLWVALRDHQSVMFQAETGFGKTVTAAFMAAAAHKNGRRAVFAVHRKELMKQTSRTFERFGIPHGFIAAGVHPDPFAHVQIASADTLRNRPEWLKCHLFIPDEAHLWAAKTRAEMISQVRENGAKIVGLSATPQRLDGKPLDGLFDTMVCGPSFEWLMERGHLSRYRLFTPVQPNMDGMHVRAGDYVTAELDERFGKPAVIGDAVRTWKQYARGMRTMVFAFSRKHGQAVAESFNVNGVGAVYIDGDTSPADRVERIERFADGRAHVLVSVNLCIEGFDLSSQVGRDVPVEAVQLLRPTASRPMARQMLGRAFRPKNAPAIIIDHVNLIRDHGLPDDPVAWSLAGRDKKASTGSPTIPLTICRACFFTGRPFSVCPACQCVVETVGRVVEEIEGSIAEVDLESIRRAKKIEEWKSETIDDLAKIAVARGYKIGWVATNARIRRIKPTHWRPDWSEIQRAMVRARQSVSVQ